MTHLTCTGTSQYIIESMSNYC